MILFLSVAEKVMVSNRDGMERRLQNFKLLFFKR